MVRRQRSAICYANAAAFSDTRDFVRRDDVELRPVRRRLQPARCRFAAEGVGSGTGWRSLRATRMLSRRLRLRTGHASGRAGSDQFSC